MAMEMKRKISSTGFGWHFGLDWIVEGARNCICGVLSLDKSKNKSILDLLSRQLVIVRVVIYLWLAGIGAGATQSKKNGKQSGGNYPSVSQL